MSRKYRCLDPDQVLDEDPDPGLVLVFGNFIVLCNFQKLGKHVLGLFVHFDQPQPLPLRILPLFGP